MSLKRNTNIMVYILTRRMPSKKQTDTDDIDFNGRSNRDGGGSGIKRRKYFPTRHGGFCINAVTGVRYPYVQGSFESLRLWQVIDSSGACDEKGYVRTRWDPSNKTPNFLFYDSPEQYSRHQKVEVSGKVCYRWHNEVKEMFPDDVFDKAAYLKIKRRKMNIVEPLVSVEKKSHHVQSEEDEWN